MSESVLIERKGRIAIATLNRPEALNALNTEVMHQLSDRLGKFDDDPAVGCCIVTGSPKTLAAEAERCGLVARSFESPIVEGFRFERRMIHALFSTRDKAEGMQVFIEKRKPNFKGV